MNKHPFQPHPDHPELCAFLSMAAGPNKRVARLYCAMPASRDVHDLSGVSQEDRHRLAISAHERAANYCVKAIDNSKIIQATARDLTRSAKAMTAALVVLASPDGARLFDAAASTNGAALNNRFDAAAEYHRAAITGHMLAIKKLQGQGDPEPKPGPAGRQWIGVYVDNAKDAALLIKTLDDLKAGCLSDFLPAVPSLDWDSFEPCAGDEYDELARDLLTEVRHGHDGHALKGGKT